MAKLTPFDIERIGEQIDQLRLFAARHNYWAAVIDEPDDSIHVQIYDKLVGLADELSRLFFDSTM